MQDARFAELGRRLIYAEHNEVLPEPTKNEIEDWIRQRISSEQDVPWTTAEKALQQARDLRKSRPEQTDSIDEIIAFLTELGEIAAGA